MCLASFAFVSRKGAPLITLSYSLIENAVLQSVRPSVRGAAVPAPPMRLKAGTSSADDAIKQMLRVPDRESSSRTTRCPSCTTRAQLSTVQPFDSSTILFYKGDGTTHLRGSPCRSPPWLEVSEIVVMSPAQQYRRLQTTIKHYTL